MEEEKREVLEGLGQLVSMVGELGQAEGLEELLHSSAILITVVLALFLTLLAQGVHRLAQMVVTLLLILRLLLLPVAVPQQALFHLGMRKPAELAEREIPALLEITVVEVEVEVEVEVRLLPARTELMVPVLHMEMEDRETQQLVGLGRQQQGARGALEQNWPVERQAVVVEEQGEMVV